MLNRGDHMNNIYLIYGEDKYLINYNINKIIKKNKDYNKIYYDMENTKIEEIVDELNTYGLFGKKIVIVRNAKFLARLKDGSEIDLTLLLKYLDNINNDSILILSNDNIDNSKKIVKKLKEVGTVIKCDKLENNELYNMILKKFMIEGYKIERRAIDEIIKRTLSDMSLINSEINKLLMYKIDEKIISFDDVCDLVSKREEDNIFELIDAVVDNDKKKIFSIYKILRDEFNYEQTKILIMIANQFRLLLQTKIMISNNINEGDIAKYLEVHPYRIKLAHQKSNRLSIDILKKYLSDLGELDYKIKSGITNKNSALELFFINL